MSRFKGIPLKTVEVEAKSKNMSLWNLYEDLIEGNEHTFDLTLGGASFDMSNNFSIKSREHFTRRIQIKKSN
jgi:hypothetical protein